MTVSTYPTTSIRDTSGRWIPGQSGNPAGKKKGTRNRATLLAAALAEGEGERLVRLVIDKAFAGDHVAARFLLGRLCPAPRGRAIALDLPRGARAGDVVAVFNATLAAMAAGEITPDEALAVTRVIDGRTKALKAWQLEKKLTNYGEVIPGDALSVPDEDGDEQEDEDIEERETPDVQTEPSPVNSRRSFASPVVTAEASGFRENGRGSDDASGSGSGDADLAELLLHSACIQPSPATIQGRREVARRALAQFAQSLR
jgi:hypothetical protein